MGAREKPLDENRVAELELRRDYPDDFAGRDVCDGRAADEVYGRAS